MGSKKHRNKSRQMPLNQLDHQQNQQASQSVIQTQTRAIVHQGPLPHPDELTAYDSILPGAAERIFAMATDEQKHRHEQEKSITDANIEIARRNSDETKRAQWMAFVIAFSGITFSVILIYAGNAIAGTVFCGAELAALVGIFLNQRTKKPPEGG